MQTVKREETLQLLEHMDQEAKVEIYKTQVQQLEETCERWSQEQLKYKRENPPNRSEQLINVFLLNERNTALGAEAQMLGKHLPKLTEKEQKIERRLGELERENMELGDIFQELMRREKEKEDDMFPLL